MKSRRLVAYFGANTGRRFMGCHYKDPRCGFLIWVDDLHADRDYDMSDDEFEFGITEEKNRARDRVVSETTRIRDECQRLEATMSALMSSVDSVAYN